MALLPSLAVFIGLAWPSAGEIGEAKDAVYQGEHYQKTLPEPKSRPKREARDPNRKERVPELDDQRSRSTNSGPATFLVWVVIGLIVLGGVAVWMREWTARSKGAAIDDNSALQPAPVAHIDRNVLTEAERLAAQGLFAEAVHALLLRTFHSIGAQRALPASLTSREVLVRVELRDDARAALGDLVAAVEVALFGGAEVSADDYARCADSFRRVLSADGVEAR